MLALLSGANPRLANDGPSVRLAKGTWKIHFDGIRESELLIVMTSKPFLDEQEDFVEPRTVKNGDVLEFDASTVVRLMWFKRGDENFVSVSAERV